MALAIIGERQAASKPPDGGLKGEDGASECAALLSNRPELEVVVNVIGSKGDVRVGALSKRNSYGLSGRCMQYH